MVISKSALALLSNGASSVAESPLLPLLGNLFPKHTIFGKIGRAQLNNYTQEHLTGAQQEANQFSADEAQKNRSFQEQMANSTYQRTVTDLQSAGLNPALAMNNGASVPTPSGNAASSVSPAGEASSLMDLIMQMKQFRLQEKLTNAQIDDLRAAAHQKDMDTKLKGIDYEWKETFNRLDERARELANSLTSEQIENVRSTRKQIEQSIKKAVAETDNEIKKGFLIEAQTNLQKITAEQQVEMFAYDKQLKKASTDAQKAQAAAAYANAAIQKGLFDSGYVDKTIDKLSSELRGLDSEADRRAAEAAIAQWKAGLRTGHLGDAPTTGIAKVDRWLNDHIFGPMFSSMYAVGDLLGSPLGGIIK